MYLMEKQIQNFKRNITPSSCYEYVVNRNKENGNAIPLPPIARATRVSWRRAIFKRRAHNIRTRVLHMTQLQKRVLRPSHFLYILP